MGSKSTSKKKGLETKKKKGVQYGRGEVRVGIRKEEEEKKKKRWAEDESNGPGGENRTSLVQRKKPNRSSLYIRAWGRFFFIFKSSLSLFFIFLSSLSSFLKFPAAMNIPRRGGRWRRHRAGVSQVPFFF